MYASPMNTQVPWGTFPGHGLSRWANSNTGRRRSRMTGLWSPSAVPGRARHKPSSSCSGPVFVTSPTSWAACCDGVPRVMPWKAGVYSGARAATRKVTPHFACRRLLNSENRLDRGTQRFELERLGNIAIGSVRHPVQHAFRGYVPGEHDDGDGAKPGVLPQLFQQ